MRRNSRRDAPSQFCVDLLEVIRSISAAFFSDPPWHGQIQLEAFSMVSAIAVVSVN